MAALKLRLKLLTKYEQDERLQNLSVHKRRLKIMQHKKDVKVILVEPQLVKRLTDTKCHYLFNILLRVSLTVVHKRACELHSKVLRQSENTESIRIRESEPSSVHVHVQ